MDLQIWFQNRRAKHKRSQREGGGSAPLSNELSPGLAFGLQQPQSIDEYIPPQLDEEMFGPGPCTMMQVVPHQVTTASPQATDQIPGALAMNPKCPVNDVPVPTISRDTNLSHHHQSNDNSNQDHQSIKSGWPQTENIDLKMFNQPPLDEMLYNVNDSHRYVRPYKLILHLERPLLKA